MLKLSIASLLTLSCLVSVAQETQSDSISTPVSKNVAIGEYRHALGTGQLIYNGKQHQGYLASIEGSAFYPVREWQPGNVFYDDFLYENILLKYDEVTDEVLVMHPSGYAITLFSPRVSYFSFRGHKFEYIPAGKSNLNQGFYDELSSGNLTILAKRKKILYENVISTGVERKFMETTAYYILNKGKYTGINNLKAVLSMLGDKKSSARQLLKRDKIKFKKNKEEALLKIAAFYNQ